MRRHTHGLRGFLPLRFSFFGQVYEEKLTPSEHVKLCVGVYRGLAEAIQYISPFMEKYSVLPVKFEIGGSMARFEMVRVRSPSKFLHDVHLGLMDAVWDGIITDDEAKVYEPYYSSALSRVGGKVELVPEELKKMDVPRVFVAIAEESVASDIDTSLYMAYQQWRNVLDFHSELSKTKVYSKFYERDINLYSMVSEMASKYTRPHAVWVKIEPI